jgi:ABC-type transport system involved in cytochrome bd biosynthesis fused ATPase/permease subunit
MELLLVNAYRALRSLRRDPRFVSLSSLVLAAIVSGTVFYWLVEDLSPIDSLYFSVMTLATVGYGDYAPQTVAGKLFTVVYVLLGVGILLSFLSTLATGVMQSHMTEQSRNHDRVARVREARRRRRAA